MIPPIASRFVAGEHMAAAVDRAEQLDARDIHAIVNLLGEHHGDHAPVVEDTETYLELLESIDRASLDASITVKPTQIGLSIDESLFEEQLDAIVEAARERELVVWIDMEDSSTTDATLVGFERAAERHPNHVGVCLQANLRRTAGDVADLAGVPGRIRLVKGAYREPIPVAYRDPDRVEAAFREVLGQLVRNHDGEIAVGTHDPALIAHAKQLQAVHDRSIQFQLLMGVRTDLRDELAADYDVAEYVPYGERWAAYFSRRVLERSENAKFAARAVLGR